MYDVYMYTAVHVQPYGYLHVCMCDLIRVIYSQNERRT